MWWANKWHKYRVEGWGGRPVYKFTQSKVQQDCFMWPRAAPASFAQTHMDTRRNITTTTHTDLSAQAATGLLCNSGTCKLIMNTANVHIKTRSVNTTTFTYVVSDKKNCAKQMGNNFYHPHTHTHILALRIMQLRTKCNYWWRKWK